MPSTFSETISQLEKNIDQNSSLEKILQLTRKINIPPNITVKDLTDFYRIALSILNGDKKNSLKEKNDMNLVKGILISEIEKTLFKGSKPGIQVPGNAAQAEPYLLEFFRYCDEHYSSDPDSIYPIHTEWNIFLKGYPVAKEILEKYLQQMERKHKRPPGYIEGLKKSVELYVQFQQIENINFGAIEGWKEYVSLLDDRRILVKSWAAKNLGVLYRVDADVIAGDLPDFIEMLQTIGNKEKHESGVLGPFIDGYDDSCMGIAALHHNETVKKNGFDVKKFILDVLVHSPQEMYHPDTQSLEFYAHEYFDNDLESLKILLRAGKEDIVLDAITCGSPTFEGRNEILEQLRRSHSSDIAKRAQHLLKIKS